MAGYEGMSPQFAASLKAMVAASGGRLKITSGKRDTAKQTVLWNAALKKYGSAAAARKWVAPPGKSNHERGNAADLSGDLKWAHANAARFGLVFPLKNEAWHIEPAGARTKGQTSPGVPDAKGDPDAGGMEPVATEAENTKTLDYQIKSFESVLGKLGMEDFAPLDEEVTADGNPV